MELADQQNMEAEGAVAGAEIPVSDGPETASPGTSPPEKPLSLREQLNKSVETVRTEEAKRARDVTTGKFVKTDAERAAEKAAAAEIPKTETEAKPASPSKAKGPPPGWSAESKAFYASLPEDHPIRKDVEKREEEISSGFSQKEEKLKGYQAIEQVIAPVRAAFQQAGIQSDAEAIKSLLNWEGAFRDPAMRPQAFRNLARQYNFDLSTLAQNPSQAPSAAQEIPDQLRPMVGQFGNVVQDVTAVKEELQRLHNARITDEITAFVNEKDQSGAPRRPHFEAVRTIMGQLMTGGAAQNLEIAYQQAVKIHPEVSAKIESERVAKETAERTKAQAEKAEAARRAAISPSGRSPNGSPTNGAPANGKGKSVRESLNGSIAELREGQRA